MKVQLEPDERRAARDAGGLGLSFFAIGVNVVLVFLGFCLFLFAIRAFILEVFGTMPGDAGRAVREWVDSLDATALGWTAVIAAIVAIGLCWVGIAVSTRILRRAGIKSAAGITWRGCLLGTLVQLALGLVSSWLLGLLWLLVGILAPWVIMVASIVLSSAASLLIGYLAGPVLWRVQIARSKSTSG